ncbi:poly rna polymerase [Stylonychia lemnae]|uniref:Poly rna polymerase n=1 Tax=Stylonychia lemnae TaxID=5949 RepID=A0A078A8Q1_STYLE|nr:poly rna polymerase [Stylonychia lemnae]|eukprot:CDW77171.1 poly rna polymerase [Stylonychia lemnae]
MSKREEKQARKSQEKDFRSDVLNTKKLILEDDFISFSSVDQSKFIERRADYEDFNADDIGDDLETKISQKYNRDQYPWLTSDTQKIRDVSIFLHNEILDFVSFISPSESDLEVRRQVVKCLKEVILSVLPTANVLVFGSCATGLNLPNSDIDLQVYQPEISEKTMITKISDAIVQHKMCRSIEVLKNAKVPIIKFRIKMLIFHQIESMGYTVFNLLKLYLRRGTKGETDKQILEVI